MIFTPFHMIKAGFGRLRRPAFDARAETALARLGVPFFPQSRFALAPSATLAVVNEILINRRRKVLELGAGLSSLYIARALEETGGALVSVDSDPDWLDFVTGRAEKAGLAGRITPVAAPLRADGAYPGWYDVETVLGALGDGGVDLLLVDGPPASARARREARAPAVPVLKEKLAPACAVFLDDIHRPSHARIAARWGVELGVTFTEHHARGGFAYAARGPAYDPII